MVTTVSDDDWFERGLTEDDPDVSVTDDMLTPDSEESPDDSFALGASEDSSAIDSLFEEDFASELEDVELPWEEGNDDGSGVSFGIGGRASPNLRRNSTRSFRGSISGSTG